MPDLRTRKGSGSAISTRLEKSTGKLTTLSSRKVLIFNTKIVLMGGWSGQECWTTVKWGILLNMPDWGLRDLRRWLQVPMPYRSMPHNWLAVCMSTDLRRAVTYRHARWCWFSYGFILISVSKWLFLSLSGRNFVFTSIGKVKPNFTRQLLLLI